MSIQGINAYGGYKLNLKDALQGKETDSTEESKKALLQSMADGASQQTSGLSMSQSALTRMQTILARIPKDENGRLTFTDAKQYKEMLEKDFRGTVAEGLRKLGVDEDVEFTLKLDPATGEMKVNCATEDKEKIEAFFEANPKLVKQFEEIHTLESATSYVGRKVSTPQLRREIQLQAASFWNNQNSDDIFSSMSSVFYKYQASSFASMTGLNTFV